MDGPTRIRHVVTDVKYCRDDADALVQAFAPAVVTWLEPDSADALKRADVAVLRAVPAHGRQSLPRVRWIHWDHAGLDRVSSPEWLAGGVIMTSSAGRSAPALAQHAFYFALALTHNVHAAMQAQQSRTWRGGSPTTGSLWGKTLGLVGLGHTGREILALARAFGMRTTVYTRSEPPADLGGIDEVFCQSRGDRIDAVLARADVLMLAVPLTDQTRHLIGRAELDRMKGSAFLVNIARGAVVDEAALVDALRRGEIAGAGLDVFENEPLPPDAPIWRAPNVLITCHETPRMPDRDRRSVAIVTENVRRFQSGEPMINALGPADMLSAAGTEGVSS